MSGQEQEFTTREEEIADRIASSTIPGTSNSGVFEGLEKAKRVAQLVENDLNNWIKIIDFRVYSDSVMSICADYRWTIYRWASNDMESFMAENDWVVMPHRLADSHDRDENEMEARYRKKFGDVWVYINIHVLFPDRAFRELNGKESYEKMKQKRIREKKLDAEKQRIRAQRRED